MSRTLGKAQADRARRTTRRAPRRRGLPRMDGRAVTLASRPSLCRHRPHSSAAQAQHVAAHSDGGSQPLGAKQAGLEAYLQGLPLGRLFALRARARAGNRMADRVIPHSRLLGVLRRPSAE